MSVGTFRPGRKAGARPTLPPGGRFGDVISTMNPLPAYERNRSARSFQRAHPGSGAPRPRYIERRRT